MSNINCFGFIPKSFIFDELPKYYLRVIFYNQIFRPESLETNISGSIWPILVILKALDADSLPNSEKLVVQY